MVFMSWEGGFLGAFDGQQLSVVEGSGVAGSPGVLTPRCSATRIRCMSAALWRNIPSLVSRPHHHHHQLSALKVALFFVETQ